MSSKISALSAASALDLTEVWPVVQGGSTKKVTGAQLETALAASSVQGPDVTHTSHLLTPANMLDMGVMRILFYLHNANLNSTSDQAFTKLGSFTNYGISAIPAFNASGNVTTAVGGIYDGASKSGNVLVAASTAWTAFSASGSGNAFTINAGVNSGRKVLSATPILSLSTPQGGTMTMEWIFIVGWVWPLG